MRAAIAIAVLTAACGDKTDDKLRVEIPAGHADAVNALVPAAWRDRIKFEVQQVVDKKGREDLTYRLAAPTGWKPGFLGGSLQPADADDFGRSPSLRLRAQIRVNSNCDGECTNKDWAAIVDRLYYQQFTSGKVKGKVVKDDKRPNGRTFVFAREPTTERQGDQVILTGDRGTNVIATWWKPGGKVYFVCEVDLGEELGATDAPKHDDLVPAFERACATVSVE